MRGRLTILSMVVYCLLAVPAIPAVLPEQGQYYSIQFTSIPMTHFEKVLTIYERLKAKGYLVYFFKTEVKGTNWVRLKVGLFPTMTQAREFGARFKEQEGFDFFVTNADVRLYASDGGHQIILTPNAIWIDDKAGQRELLLFGSEAIEAIDVLERMEFTLSPDGDYFLWRLDSQQYTIQLNDQQSATEQTEHDMEAENGDAETFYQQGFALYKKEQLEQAKVYFGKALRLDPQLVSAYYYRGVVHYRQEKYDLAIADCTSAVKINPLHTEAYNIRALVWLEKGEVDRAIRDCDRVLKIDPQNIAAYSTLGVAWLQKGELDWACSDLRKACDLGRCETLETVRKQGYCTP
ncbi:MAG: tetratricopeptide repeat protein [Thermodesulfobacteriota bacterium]